nr:integrase, catalytic region, zinc finger, CCHC-type, peptidase aspartic, catalytic [Tanacetum cinerariifolium]
LYDSIKLTRAKHIEQVTALTTENVNLKAQILKVCYNVIKDHVKPTVLAPGKYAIDVEPISSRLRNNRDAHLDYLRQLKESAETIYEIVEEDKVVRPLDRVSRCTDASGSQPRSNTKKNRISPAKGVNKMQVEEQPRTNKSHLRTTNHVDSSSHSKSTVINLNSDYVCQTCNKCLISTNHDMCVVDYLQSVVARPSIRNNCNVVSEVKQVWKPKQFRQVWKPTGSHGSNLYSISVEDMMKSSPICLLSKASKNKSWLWHRHLNQLNFGTINDLARKDLVRAKILENYNQQLILKYSLVMHQAGKITSGLITNPVPTAPYVPPRNKDLEILFQPMFDEYLKPHHFERPVSPAPAVQVPVNSAGTPSSTTIDQDSTSPSISPSSSALQSPSLHQGVAAESTLMEDNHVAPVDNNHFINVFASESNSDASSSGDVGSIESTYVSQTLHYLSKWSKDHPLDNVIGNPSRLVSTKKQLATDALWLNLLCMGPAVSELSTTVFRDV